jgi:hypothetical protein
MRRGLAGLAALTVALLVVGCFETKYPLASRPPGQPVEAKYLGDWTLEQLDDDGQTNVSKLIVRSLRGEEYFVEWVTNDGDQDDRYRATGYLTDVNGVTFVNLLPLTNTPAPADKFTIMRVDLDGAKLKLMNLNPEFFKGKAYDSSDALRQIVADNLENEKMYTGRPLFGTKG